VSSVNCLVIVECIVADFPELVSVKIGSEVIGCAGIPVLRIPGLGRAVNCLFSRDWSVDEFIPITQVSDLVDCRVGVVKVVA